jgi:hypothetical protein
MGLYLVHGELGLLLKKTAPPKKRYTHLKKGELTLTTTPKTDADFPPKKGDIELIPCRGSYLIEVIPLNLIG